MWSIIKREIKYIEMLFGKRLDSSVVNATGNGLDGRGSIPGMGKIFSSPQRPDRVWGPPSLLSNG
jgi:hypothetical protein